MDTFSAQDWILIIGAIGVVVSNVITNWRNTAKLDAVNATAKVIEGHVNSATTKADERADAAARREGALQETIIRLRTAADLLAQAAAIKDASRRNTDTGYVPVAVAPIAVVPVHDSTEPIVEHETKDEKVPKATPAEIKKIADNLEIKPKDKK